MAYLSSSFIVVRPTSNAASSAIGSGRGDGDPMDEICHRKALPG